MMTTLRWAAPVRRVFRAPGLACMVTAVLTCAGCASSSPASGTSPVVVPVLGRPAGAFAHGTGFGLVKPAKIFNGGDPTGILTHITWKSWGGADAVGIGKTDYVGPGQSVATGKEEQATVEASSWESATASSCTRPSSGTSPSMARPSAPATTRTSARALTHQVLKPGINGRLYWRSR